MIAAFKKAVSLLDNKRRGYLYILFLLIIAGSAFEIVSIGLVFPLLKLVVDPAIADNIQFLAEFRRAIEPATDAGFLIIVMIAFGLIFSAKNLFLFFASCWQNWFILNCEADVGQRLFQGYLASPYKIFLQRNSAEMIRNLTECLTSLYTGVLTFSMRAISEAIVAASIIAILFVSDPVTATIAATMLGVGLGAIYLFLRKPLVRWGRDRYEWRRQRLQCLQECLNGVKEIKVLGREKFFADVFLKIQQKLVRVQILTQASSEFPRIALEILMVWVLILVVLHHLSRGLAATDTIATIGLFAAAGFRLMPSASRLINAIAVIRQSLPAVGWIDADFRAFARDRVADRFVGGKSPIEFKLLELEGVSFVYPSASTNALRHIDLKMRFGETIALVGASGAGKSTLADIILGLYAPTTGRVLINGKEASVDDPIWHRLIGYVPQSIYIFDDTLKRNIALGNDDSEIDPVRLSSAIELAQVSEFLPSLPDGLNTVLGERGVRLSGGQRQRVGIARALYSDPQLLIFDEATSALDGETELAITGAIDRLRGEKTTILIAHRLSTVRHCDQILLMKEGHIVDRGTFAELSFRSKDFQRMIELGSLDVIATPHENHGSTTIS